MEMTAVKEEDQNLGSGDGFFRSTGDSQFAKSSKQTSFIGTLKKLLISIPYQIVITVLTIYSLVADDIRIIAFEKDADIAFDAINIVLICVFTAEIVLSSIAVERYFLSFFFVLDIISTLSFFFDVSLFTDLIYSSDSNSYSFSQVAAQSKASRAAIRAVRIVKLFRIIRIVKLYKSALKAEEIEENRRREKELRQRMLQKFEKHQNRNRQSDLVVEENSLAKMELNNAPALEGGDKRVLPEELLERSPQKLELPHYSEDSMAEPPLDRKPSQEEVNELFNTELLEEIDRKESKIRKVMGDNTLKKVIVVVLALMFLVPLFDSEVYLDQANSFDFTVANLDQLLQQSGDVPLQDIVDLIDRVLDDHKDEEHFLIYFATPFNELPYYQNSNFFNTRISDFTASTQTIDTAAIMALRPTLTLRSNITEDLERETILAIVDSSVFNENQSFFSLARTTFVCLVLILLLHFFNSDLEELIVHPIEEMMQKLKEMAEDPESASKEEIVPNAHFETTIVSNAIIKIGALLSIVFGSAGAEIIGKNIVQEGDMNPMLEGRKKCAIFGFCDIRKFSEINEILEEDILLFVNKISSIVHKAVYRYGGSANKNIGEAFLLVWKVPEADYEINGATNEITWKRRDRLSVQADFAVYSFIKTLVKINKSPEVLEYRHDHRLLERLPRYRVEMGFGLHIGWAIEGAIGSEFKIDASYLSPNVNMASRLEAATKQFGLDLLLSESLYELLTPGLQAYCRNVDRVTVKGSNKPLRLYTIDMNLERISPCSDKSRKYPNVPNYQPDIELKRDLNMQFLTPEHIQKYHADNFIDSKKEFREVLVNAVPAEFKSRFDLGLQSYLKGRWADAKLHFTHASKIHSSDGPTKRLLSFMKNYDFVAPPTWNNYRELTSK